MKIWNVITKSLKEQVRSYWVLLLSLSMGPFFILVYYLIIETSKPRYDLLVLNHDKGILINGQTLNYGNELIAFMKSAGQQNNALPFTIYQTDSQDESIAKLKNKTADALVVVDSSFSASLASQMQQSGDFPAKLEFAGDLTNTYYLVTAVWAGELITEFVHRATGKSRAVTVTETALGTSGSINDFDIIVPGILMISLIMLMFTASIAFVSEVENKTMIRLKLSKISAFEFVSGVGIVQLLVGIASVILTLLTAILLDFHYSGSLLIMILIAVLTSLSVISFSLIIAALTKSAGEVLVVGNFPMFLFMFFTGAAFPLKNDALFTIAGYPVNIQGLMTPTHAISALGKTLVMNMDFWSILPELITILILTMIYFIIGALLFKKRHLKLV